MGCVGSKPRVAKDSKDSKATVAEGDRKGSVIDPKIAKKLSILTYGANTPLSSSLNEAGATEVLRLPEVIQLGSGSKRKLVGALRERCIARGLEEAQQIASKADFSELKGIGYGCEIAAAEERGMNLQQLRGLSGQIDRRCIAEGWTTVAGDRLTPETVTMHDAVRYVIKPATATRLCSYVEVFAPAPQPPEWVVSHWWGEPVRRLLAALYQHAQDYQLGGDSCYWLAACATNQWAADDDEQLGADPAQLPLHRALALARGTVTVADEGGAVFGRLWCGFEAHASIAAAKAGHLWARPARVELAIS